jgi:gamma-glutamylcyclotransferase (GGCT)/AIG2-like uncharacterized protein YtfP
MALLFSYGTLQQVEVQIATYGRPLHGQPDQLIGFSPSRVPITDAEMVRRLGQTHHANVTPSTDLESRVAGTVLELTEDELAKTDVYEAPFAYRRIVAQLASGREAWVYVHAP